MTRGPAPGETMASLAYGRVRREIITAQLQPGQKLNIRELCTRLGAGLSPVREALNRLTSEGLVTQTDQRGFRVKTLSLDDLADLQKARYWLNEVALRESIALGDDRWEEAIVLAYHRLSRTPRDAGDGERPNPDWQRAHRQFHESLIAACGSGWVLGFCEQLFDASEQYRNIARVARMNDLRPIDAEHKAIMEAAVARRADDAVTALLSHFGETAEIVRREFAHRPSTAGISTGQPGGDAGGIATNHDPHISNGA